ncbi:MAG: hypothetical protein FJX29_12920, partial [Alphaproteobacteria bacterium]|nr:hypothetical protein [Alphaproteobacteria bacterium]
VWAGALGLAGAAQAQGAAEFYKGRQVSIIMGTGPGGSYDLYGRIIAQFLPMHLPGSVGPMVVEHMPGAGGAIAANHMFGPGPQDGSKILLSHSLPLIEMLQGSNVRFKSAQFQWLGAYDEIAQVLAIWHNQPGKTLEELKTGQAVLGAMGRSHLSYQWATLLKGSLGAQYRIVTGYTTGGSLNAAMERGEISGWTVAWENISGRNMHWVTDKKINVLVTFTLTRMKPLPDVPTILEVATGEAREVAEFLAAGTPHARGLTVGPKVPADRVAMLRSAFDAMMQNKEFLDEAQKRGLAMHHRTAKELDVLTAKIVNASPEFIAKVKKVVDAP